jgi:hypothetical protein
LYRKYQAFACYTQVPGTEIKLDKLLPEYITSSFFFLDIKHPKKKPVLHLFKYIKENTHIYIQIMLSKISSIRLISVALVICSILFISSYLIRIDQQNTLQLELDAQKAKETILAFQEQERVKSIQLENQRQLQIEQNKTIHEPGNMNMHNQKVYFRFLYFNTPMI